MQSTLRHVCLKGKKHLFTIHFLLILCRNLEKDIERQTSQGLLWIVTSSLFAVVSQSRALRDFCCLSAVSQLFRWPWQSIVCYHPFSAQCWDGYFFIHSALSEHLQKNMPHCRWFAAKHFLNVPVCQDQCGLFEQFPNLTSKVKQLELFFLVS